MTSRTALDVEATLAYAEHVLTHLPSLWRDCTPHQRQALGRVLSPRSRAVDGVFCQTTTWAFGFSGLEFPKGGTDLVAQTFASWNLLTSWLRYVDGLRCAT